MDTGTLTSSQKLRVYRHHLSLALVPQISLTCVSDLLIPCGCLPGGSRQLWLAAMPSPPMPRGSWKDISFFHLLMVYGAERPEKYSPKSNSSQRSWGDSRQMEAAVVVVSCKRQKTKSSSLNQTKTMKWPPEKGKGKSPCVKTWNWIDPLNHSQEWRENRWLLIFPKM